MNYPYPKNWSLAITGGKFCLCVDTPWIMKPASSVKNGTQIFLSKWSIHGYTLKAWVNNAFRPKNVFIGKEKHPLFIYVKWERPYLAIYHIRRIFLYYSTFECILDNVSSSPCIRSVQIWYLSWGHQSCFCFDLIRKELFSIVYNVIVCLTLLQGHGAE